MTVLFADVVHSVLPTRLPESAAGLATPGCGHNRLITAVLQRAVQHGQAGPQALMPQLISLHPTLLSHRFLLNGAPIADETIHEILDEVVMPLIHP